MMPFGASNITATLQRLMKNCLGDLNFSLCVVYLDDIIVSGRSHEEHLKRLAAVFEKLRQAKLKNSNLPNVISFKQKYPT